MIRDKRGYSEGQQILENQLLLGEEEIRDMRTKLNTILSKFVTKEKTPRRPLIYAMK